MQNDSLLALIGMANADPRPDKIDVGVGVFRDGAGNTPILKVIKEAEQRLVDTQKTKAYLGSSGDKRFAELLRPILLGAHAGDDRITGLQTPGGCGALRLGFELIATANPGARVFVGTPTWPNHPPIVRAVGLSTVEYPYYERGQAIIRFEDMIAALEVGRTRRRRSAPRLLPQSDRRRPQRRSMARSRPGGGRARALPLIDIAYQGFGRGLDEDAFGVRLMLDACDEVIIAQSCDKNFSVYRDRVGSLWVKTGSAEATATAMAHVHPARARDVVDAARSWRRGGAHHSRGCGASGPLAGRADGHARPHQLGPPAHRIGRPAPGVHRPAVRHVLDAAAVEGQVLKLRADDAIYMAESGRFNVVGMGDGQIDRFIAAVVGAMDA